MAGAGTVLRATATIDRLIFAIELALRLQKMVKELRKQGLSKEAKPVEVELKAALLQQARITRRIRMNRIKGLQRSRRRVRLAGREAFTRGGLSELGSKASDIFQKVRRGPRLLE